MLNRKNVLKFVSLLLTIGAIFYGFTYLNVLVSEINKDSLSINYWLIASSVILFVLFYLLLSFHWNRVCNYVNKNQSSQYLSFFASQPYKYLPTSLFTFSFRAKYSKDLGVSVKKSSIAQLVENFNMLSTGFLVGLIFYLIFVNLEFIALTIIFLILVIIKLLPTLLSINVKSKKISINKSEQFNNMVLTSLAWVISGLSFYLLSRGLGTEISMVEAVSSSALAYTLGILAFFAPGGIGVREWVFTLFSVSNVSVLCWRILTFFADIILGLVGIILIGLRNRS